MDASFTSENRATWKDDDQGLASSGLSADIGEKASLYLEKTTARAQPLDAIDKHWDEDVTLFREDDDQDAASSILSTDIGGETSLYLGKTTTRVQHPRYYRRIVGRKRHFT